MLATLSVYVYIMSACVGLGVYQNHNFIIYIYRCSHVCLHICGIYASYTLLVRWSNFSTILFHPPYCRLYFIKSSSLPRARAFFAFSDSHTNENLGMLAMMVNFLTLLKYECWLFIRWEAAVAETMSILTNSMRMPGLLASEDWIIQHEI